MWDVGTLVEIQRSVKGYCEAGNLGVIIKAEPDNMPRVQILNADGSEGRCRYFAERVGIKKVEY